MYGFRFNWYTILQVRKHWLKELMKQSVINQKMKKIKRKFYQKNNYSFKSLWKDTEYNYICVSISTIKCYIWISHTSYHLKIILNTLLKVFESTSERIKIQIIVRITTATSTIFRRRRRHLFCFAITKKRWRNAFWRLRKFWKKKVWK